ncbi:hypothetical protein LCGC14_1986970, partial [marine sediment metagenome]
MKKRFKWYLFILVVLGSALLG